jgi:hypothetical protein
MRRPALILAAFAAPLLAAGTAAAQDGGVGGSFASGDFFIGVQHIPGDNLSDFDVARFFNKATCDCSETVYVYVALQGPGLAKRATADRSGNLEVWVGSDCANTVNRDQRCALLESNTLAAFLNAGRATIQTTARVLSTYTGSATTIDGGVVGGVIFPPEGNPTCTLPLETYNQTLWVLSNVNGTPVNWGTRAVAIDLTAPPSPPPPSPGTPGVTVEPGNQALTITWPPVDSAIYTDLLGYQILCNRGGELQVFDDGTFAPGYLSASALCPDKVSASGTGVNGLDPRFICSPLLSATTQSFRIKILQNDIPYGAAVVSIDKSGNASTPDIFYGVPIKTKSFYDVYRNDDPDHPGTANGGLCTLAAGATSRGAVAGLVAGLAIAAIALARRRRSRR